ncbi:MAG TPA: hypothetical protein VLG36_00560 [Candidatus Chromulinivoraceae bacterium]|nr:hypothetical protein [Candidatus Chromulinivoraceae bacterium]
MKILKIIRSAIGLLLIVCGISTAVLSVILLIQRTDWGLFTVMALGALVIVVVGIQVMVGEGWRKIVDFLTDLYWL